MIVCHCRVVNDATVRAAVDRGAKTLAGLCRSTGAGQDCGGCVFTVKSILCEHDLNRAATVEETSHASQELASR